MSLSEIIGIFGSDSDTASGIQWVLLLYLFTLLLFRLPKFLTDLNEGWTAYRIRRLRFLADSLREGSETRDYLERSAESEAFRAQVGLPWSVSPNQQKLAMDLSASGEFTENEIRYATEFMETAQSGKVRVVMGWEDRLPYWWSVLGVFGLSILVAFYALLSVLGGFSVGTVIIVAAEIALGVPLLLWQMRATFVTRRLVRKLAVAGLLETRDPRHWSDPLKYPDGLLFAIRQWRVRRLES